ncbi:MAG: hypothetical protein D6690_05130 [Nitrospirae bacterium]|nr:MAG: hypothetical protein D6690_05130 [Nitrospirota bacterium]
MSRVITRPVSLLALAMVILLVAVSGLISVHVAEHSIDHAHHHRSVHSTALCAWFCAAGDTHGVPMVMVKPPVFLIEDPIVRSACSCLAPASIALVSRAPPRLSLV